MEGQPGNGDIVQDMDAAFRGMARLTLWQEFSRIENLVPKTEHYACFKLSRVPSYVVYIRDILPAPINTDAIIRNRKVLNPEHPLEPEYDLMECTAWVRYRRGHMRGINFHRENVPRERRGWALPNNTPLISAQDTVVTLAMRQSTLLHSQLEVPLTDGRDPATPEQIGMLMVGSALLQQCGPDTLDRSITHLLRLPET